MRIKKVMRYDPYQRKFRICRFVWGTYPGDPGFTHALSLGIQRILFTWQREEGNGYYIVVAGVQIHWKSGLRGLFLC